MELINSFSEVFSSQLWWTFTKNTFVSESKKMSILKDFTFQRPSGLMTISGEAERDNLTAYKLRSDLKFCHNNNNQRNSCQRDRDEKIKKSVSFEEEVIVHLFDQESPTMKLLLPESCASLPNSFSSNLPFQPAFSSENSDLQWDDDFSVLEKTCCFQCAQRFHAVPSSSRDRTAQSRPERSSLSQSCLILTYVTESDLEL